MKRSLLIQQLATTILAGETTASEIVKRCSHTLGSHWKWLPPLAKRYEATFAEGPRPRRREVEHFIREDRGFLRAWQKYGSEFTVEQWLTPRQQMQPVAAASTWDLPQIESVGDLAAWFGVSVDDLAWFADLKGLNHRSATAQLGHYHYRALVKDSGDIRLIEAPKRRLKQLQQQVLSRILEKVPPHPAVHGFVKGRSITTCVSLHTGKAVVMRLDLKDFFPSFCAARIQTMFRTFGYPERVADMLGGICTNFIPSSVFARENFDPPLSLQARQWMRDLYCRPHLPQGAPTSPLLANICCYRLDCRLTGLARSASATYTRYADDLAFSGEAEFARSGERFALHVAAICLEEGFHVNHRKTRIMRQGVRQRVVGLVANQHPNVIRTDFDRFKATLHNCLRSGPAAQNRGAHADFRAHLEGKVAFVESVNAARGLRLRNLLRRIEW